MKRGFSFILAIIFVVLISSLGALSLTLSIISSKQTGDIFAKEQGELMLDSFAEYVMLVILKHDFNSGCLSEINGQTQGGGYSGLFKMQAKIKYFGKIGTCNGTAVTTPQTQGTVLIDVFATHTKDTSGNASTMYPVRLHKRIIQKI